MWIVDKFSARCHKLDFLVVDRAKEAGGSSAVASDFPVEINKDVLVVDRRRVMNGS